MVPKSFTDAPPLRLGGGHGHGRGMRGGYGERMDGPGDGESTVTSSASEMMHMHEPYGGGHARGRHGRGYSHAGGAYDHAHDWGVNLHEQPHAGDGEKENERELDPDLERFGTGSPFVPVKPKAPSAGHHSAGTFSVVHCARSWWPSWCV